MSLTLISATPSPFARMNRIALALKSIPFTLQNEVPWDSTTKTPTHNPLEKLPILLFSDGRAPVYDSAHIQEYIVQKYADKEPRLLTGDVDWDLEARQVVVLAEGLMDAFVLRNFEVARDEEKRSQEWLGRQERKIDGALRAMEELAGDAKGREGEKYLVGGVLTVADIAVVCAVGQVEFAGIREGWREKYPRLAAWYDRMDEREEFKSTRPVMFEIKDKIV